MGKTLFGNLILALVHYVNLGLSEPWKSVNQGEPKVLTKIYGSRNIGSR